MEISLDTRLVRAEHRYLSNRVGEETILLDLHTGDYIALNETAASVWEILHQPCTVQELTVALGQAYDVAPDQCVEETLDFLRGMGAFHLLAPA